MMDVKVFLSRTNGRRVSSRGSNTRSIHSCDASSVSKSNGSHLCTADPSTPSSNGTAAEIFKQVKYPESCPSKWGPPVMCRLSGIGKMRCFIKPQTLLPLMYSSSACSTVALVRSRLRNLSIEIAVALMRSMRACLIPASVSSRLNRLHCEAKRRGVDKPKTLAGLGEWMACSNRWTARLSLLVVD